METDILVTQNPSPILYDSQLFPWGLSTANWASLVLGEGFGMTGSSINKKSCPVISTVRLFPTPRNQLVYRFVWGRGRNNYSQRSCFSKGV